MLHYTFNLAPMHLAYALAAVIAVCAATAAASPAPQETKTSYCSTCGVVCEQGVGRQSARLSYRRRSMRVLNTLAQTVGGLKTCADGTQFCACESLDHEQFSIWSISPNVERAPFVQVHKPNSEELSDIAATEVREHVQSTVNSGTLLYLA
ncbi:hypothetical protein BKA62DRAFT_105620 [Auriculariales sp. MPI-PUGE-AT-0066]|nr:hypothetical protein BKA62DRAFT_105620 [Auriculariales sp. MPI-PUGE-AT-0066]